jgi:hypothetical protein
MQGIISKSGRRIYRANGNEDAPYRLVEEIIARSVAAFWQDAKREWTLSHIYYADPEEPSTCLCDHSPIIEHCVLLNRENGNVVIVGNVCVTQFMGIPAENLFAALRRIMDDLEAALNAAAIEYAYSKGWIDDWKRNFYLSTWRKRKLSSNQLAKRVEINEVVLRRAREGCKYV